MPKIVTIYYEDRARENLKSALLHRKYNEAINKALKENKNASVFLLETPADNYLEANLASIRSLVNNGFEGVYLSFQRPFNNIYNLFKQNDIDIKKLQIIDGATAICGESYKKNARCIQLSRNLEIDEIANVIFTTLLKIKNKSRFIFIDSLTTMRLYEPLSKVMRLPEFLMNSMEKDEMRNVLLFFNVAENLAKNNYIENISIYADEHIHLGLCT